MELSLRLEVGAELSYLVTGAMDSLGTLRQVLAEEPITPIGHEEL